jgi:hypothetical protein
MKTETTPTEKKAYHQPELRDFGAVQEGTHATTDADFTPDNGTNPPFLYTYGS